jgi:hypothetical protein
MGFHFGLVAVDDKVVAEYPTGGLNVRWVVVDEILIKLPPGNHRRTVVNDKYSASFNP